MRILSFLIRGEYFAVDVTHIQAVARKMTVTPVFAAPPEISGIANMKGRVVTVINLYKLLGYNDKRGEKRTISTVNAIVFKSFTGGEDQLALTIGRPGALLDIEDENIRLITGAARDEEGFCVSRIVEVDHRLYRIVDIDSIINKYRTNGDMTEENTVNGGNEE